MKLKTFRIGGIHPPDNKLSTQIPIKKLDVPKQIFIPVSQHLGAPAVPIVIKGDKVKVGTLIAKGEAFISSNIHSSVSGTVSKIDEVIDSTGYRQKSIIIDVEGDEWEESIDKSDSLKKEIKLEQKEIIEKIKEMGIVGLGGACFPTHVKLMIPEGKKIDTLVINGVECEPYLTSDHRIMLERTDEIIVGIQILKKALGGVRTIVGIEANKMDAIELFQERVKLLDPEIEIAGLKVMYPQGGEKQLLKSTVNREVPMEKLPLDVGCVVSNVGTALAVYEAVQKNKPLFERVVTITGKTLEKRGNFLVRIGTPVDSLVEAVGGLGENISKVINGGPMMGKTLSTTSAPVTKGTSGIILIDKSEALRNEPTNCIRCGKCTSVCCMHVEPWLIEKLVEQKRWEDAEREKIMLCAECGSCSYICPASRPLLDYIRLGKSTLLRLRRERSKK